MVPLDIWLLRAMFLGSIQSIGNFDPRLSVQALARSVGVSRVTVRRRLARWRDEGFCKRVTAFPNPDALGTSFQMQAVVLDRGRTRSRSESALVDVLEPAFLYQSEDVYNPVLLAESREVSDRRQKRLRDIEGVHVLCPPLPFPCASSSVPLGLRDWKIIRSLRRFPVPDWPAVSKEVGVTVRGLQRRVARLMHGSALMFHPELDFRRSPGAVAWVGVLFGMNVDRSQFEADMVRRYPDLLRVEPVFPFENVLPPSDRPPVDGRFPFFLPVANAAAGDQLRHDLMTVPGVVDVVVGFPTRNFSIPHAFGTRIEAAIGRLEPSVRLGREPHSVSV